MLFLDFLLAFGAFAFLMIRQLFYAFCVPLPGNGNFGQQGVARPNVSSLVSNSL